MDFVKMYTYIFSSGRFRNMGMYRYLSTVTIFTDHNKCFENQFLKKKTQEVSVYRPYPRRVERPTIIAAIIEGRYFQSIWNREC